MYPAHPPRPPRERSITVGERKIIAVGVADDFWSDLSHKAMTTSWPKFVAATAAVFVALNAMFALAYFVGSNPIANTEQDLLHYFYFSVETLATVGYGDMHPQTHYGHIIASIESFISIFCVALITGLIFSRFSRPRARILFARAPIMSSYDGQPAFMLRIANERHNSISDATAKLWFLRRYSTSEGRRFRGFAEMRLVRSENPTFQLSWTLFHPIDEHSPLRGLTREDLADLEGAFTVTINGRDENSAQSVHSKMSYLHTDLKWNHHYADILSTSEGVTRLDYGLFHHTVEDAGQR